MFQRWLSRGFTAPAPQDAAPCRHPGARRDRVSSAFTLIELLVVIAIIAVLAAILFPVFAQAREKARQAACLSNLKQLGLALMQYAQDFDETLPVYGAGAECRGRWQWQLYNYVNNGQVFTCPDFADAPWNVNTVHTSGAPCAGLVVHDDVGGGYGWNLDLGYDGRGDTGPGFALPRIGKPAETIIIGDTGILYGGSAGQGWAMFPSDPRNATLAQAQPQPGLYPNFRHMTTATMTVVNGLKLPIAGRANFIFLDGHAKNLDIDTVFQKAATEDGHPLAAPETSPSQVIPTTQYILWNIY